VDIKNSGELYYDVALKDALFSKDMQISAWENVR